MKTHEHCNRCGVEVSPTFFKWRYCDNCLTKVEEARAGRLGMVLALSWIAFLAYISTQYAGR